MNEPRGPSDRQFLHLRMRPVSERQVVRTFDAWVVFAWALIAVVVTFVVLMIVFAILFFTDPGIGA